MTLAERHRLARPGGQVRQMILDRLAVRAGRGQLRLAELAEFLFEGSACRADLPEKLVTKLVSLVAHLSPPLAPVAPGLGRRRAGAGSRSPCRRWPRSGGG